MWKLDVQPCLRRTPLKSKVFFKVFFINFYVETKVYEQIMMHLCSCYVLFVNSIGKRNACSLIRVHDYISSLSDTFNCLVYGKKKMCP